MFYIRFFILKIRAIRSFLFFNEQFEQIAQVAHQKWATMSDSLRLLTKNEQPWANCSGRSPKMSNHERIAQVAHQKWANRLLFWANRSFAHFFAKKRAFRSENRWANSQPCIIRTIVITKLFLSCAGGVREYSGGVCTASSQCFQSHQGRGCMVGHHFLKNDTF